MSDGKSSLLKAASESDLAALPQSPAPSPKRQPSPRASSSRRAFEETDYPHPASPRLSSTHSPPRSPSAQQTSSIPYQQPKPTVSFSEYVANELAHHNSAGVHFAPAEDPVPPAAHSPHSLPDPFDPVAPPELDLNLVDSRKEKRSDTLPDLAAEFDIPYHHDSEDPFNGAAVFASKARYGKLHCLQIDTHGDVTERELTRPDILNEARATLSAAQPSPTTVGRWLTGATPPGDSYDIAGLLPGAAKSRKAAQKAMRDYLRNSLQARDIRQVDPAFAAKPALWVRHSAIVVSLEGLRAIILHNKMFLFDPENDRTRQLVVIAKQSILAKPDAENPQPFEFRALEGILIFLAMGLDREFESLKPQIDTYIHQLPNELTTKMLEELRLKKQQLHQFHSRATNVKAILEGLLDEDEDMANMYLSEKQASGTYLRDAIDHNEVETLIEAYLQIIDEHVNHSTLLNDAIDDTEDLVMIHLDTLRNRLLSVELSLSVVSMTFGLGGVIAGMFGMNMQIPWFEPTSSRAYFFAVVAFILVLITVGSYLAVLYLRRRGLYSFY